MAGATCRDTRAVAMARDDFFSFMTAPPLFRLATPPRFQANHISNGNLVYVQLQPPQQYPPCHEINLMTYSAKFAGADYAVRS